MINFIQLNNLKDNLKTIFEIKFAYVTNETAETSIKSDIYHYTTPFEMVICDSDGVTGDHLVNRTGKEDLNYCTTELPAAWFSDVLLLDCT
jgi:hypothetical protein